MPNFSHDVKAQSTTEFSLGEKIMAAAKVVIAVRTKPVPQNTSKVPETKLHFKA